MSFKSACETAETQARCPTPLSYGTAGFRTLAQNLDGAMYRVGILAALRSLQTHVASGVMITASHNGIEDNGVKIVDGDGGMLVRSWEKYACDLVNAAPGALWEVLQGVAKAEGLDVGAPPAAAPMVVMGRDTRPSSPRLFAQCAAGVEACGGVCQDTGVVTTPQLHHCVRWHNAGGDPALKARYGGLGGYVTMLLDGYAGVLGEGTPPGAEARGPLVIDCAHGVGALAAGALAPPFAPFVRMVLRNTGDTPEAAAALNDGVGAEHCQKERLPPAGFTPEALGGLGVRCASLDGDADRLVYHYFAPSSAPASGGGSGGTWRLLDGDKIAALAAAFLSDLLKDSGLTFTGTPAHTGEHGSSSGSGSGSHGAGATPSSSSSSSSSTPQQHSPGEALESLLASPVSVGIVQTAYANGASGRYMSGTLGLPVALAKTGVKYVHAAAAAFDIGVYFEANGHGTVLFHESFAGRLQAACGGLGREGLARVLPGGAPAATALLRLAASTLLINQAVGDALSDALFVEAVLCVKGWGVGDWDALYTDLPSRQAKLPVADRSVVRTIEDESRCTAPPGLQEAIDALVAAVPSGRAFVRPSGTEDVVRAYAEAATQEEADALCKKVLQAVHRLAGGLGAAP